MKHRKTFSIEPAMPDRDKPDDDDPMGTAAAARKTDVRLPREIQARIGQQLRALYDDVVNQGVPPHIAELIRRLSQEDNGSSE